MSAREKRMMAIQVLQQPTCTFWRYEEVYAFELEDAPPRVIDRIVEFFGGFDLPELVVDKNEVSFVRGSLWGSLFSPRETRHRQVVKVTVELRDPLGAGITCHYDCFDPYPNLHCSPRLLQEEVEALLEHLAPSANS